MPALSPRLRQIWALIAKGNTIRQIAGQLALSHKTVSRHRCKLNHRLHAKGTADITRKAIAFKIIPVPKRGDFSL